MDYSLIHVSLIAKVKDRIHGLLAVLPILAIKYVYSNSSIIYKLSSIVRVIH